MKYRFPQQEIFLTPLTDQYLVAFNLLRNNSLVTCLNQDSLKILHFCSTAKTKQEIATHFPNLNLDKLSLILKQLLRCKCLVNKEQSDLIIDPKPSLLSAWLHITNQCNLRCKYCYLYKSKDEMSWQTAQKAVDCVFRVACLENFKTVKFKLSGGEASLRAEFLSKLVKYINLKAKKNKIPTQIVLLSNGVNLSPLIIDLLLTKKIEIMISLDGLQKHHDKQRIFANGIGSFNLVDKTLKKLLSLGIKPIISVTISRQNAPGLPALTKYLLDHNLVFAFNLYRENSCSIVNKDLAFKDQEIISAFKQAFKVIAKNLPKASLLRVLLDRTDLSYPHLYSCGVARNYLIIDQQGKIAKCQTQIKDTFSSVEDKNPLQILKQEPRGVINLSVNKKTKCKTCQWRYYCTGGCPLTNFNFCKIYQALLPEVIKLEGLRLLKYHS